ncbi:MAG: hypothetical protein RQ760_10420 [Sedimentisphaerales bacterium]|nr:hypothetical protein [Sedimentisphaerales bacterium]
MSINSFLPILAQEKRIRWEILFFIGFMAFVIFCIHRIAKYFNDVKTEQKLMRMEIAKIADELEKERKQEQGNIENNPLDKSV